MPAALDSTKIKEAATGAIPMEQSDHDQSKTTFDNIFLFPNKVRATTRMGGQFQFLYQGFFFFLISVDVLISMKREQDSFPLYLFRAFYFLSLLHP